jgi:hypothetical protein
MSTTVSLQQPTLRVEPGGSVSTEMRVRNSGTVVDQFSFQPLGDAAPWITVDPPTVRLFPDTDEVVTITIAPPRDSSSRAGVATWAVKAVPKEDPAGAAVSEGTVDVGAFVDLGAELQPVTGRGRLVGRFELAIDNRGNVAVPVRINGTDAEQSLGFEVDPAQVDAQPGSAHFAKLRITPAQRIWRGQPKNHPFQILVEPQARLAPGDGEAGQAPSAPMAPIVVNGNLLQEPVFPKWLLKALLALIALLIALFVLWKTLLKPSVESAAREVALEEVAPVSSAVEQLEPAVEEAAAQAEQASEQAAAAEEAAGGGGGGGGGGGSLVNVLNETSVPAFFRVAAQANVGASSVAAAPANAADTTFAITDMWLQNPGGDRGRIRVSIGSTLISESALESFLDLDFHSVAPYVAKPGEAISIEVVCAPDQLVPADPCDVGVLFSGFQTTITETPAATVPPATQP